MACSTKLFKPYVNIYMGYMCNKQVTREIFYHDPQQSKKNVPKIFCLNGNIELSAKSITRLSNLDFYPILNAIDALRISSISRRHTLAKAARTPWLTLQSQ